MKHGGKRLETKCSLTVSNPLDCEVKQINEIGQGAYGFLTTRTATYGRSAWYWGSSLLPRRRRWRMNASSLPWREWYREVSYIPIQAVTTRDQLRSANVIQRCTCSFCFDMQLPRGEVTQQEVNVVDKPAFRSVGYSTYA